MHDTSVPNLSVWSGPAAPLCCLANKSQARLCSESLQSALEANLSGPGSMIYQTVWKPHTTPLGRQIYRLRASARRTSDSEHSLVRSGWGTPVGQQANGTPEAFLERKRKSMANGSQSMGVCLSDLNMQVQAWAGWNTPRATDGSNGGPNQAGGALTPDAALSGWPTPMAGTPAQNGNNEAGNNDSSRKTVALSGWPTPTLGSPNSLRGHGQEPSIRKAGGHSVNLQDMVRLSGWPTPTSRDHKDGKECPNVPLNALGRVAWLTANPQAARITADGTMLTGCSAGMESGGRLNPAFSGWLMGFPEAWCHAAISCQLPAPLRKAPKKPVA